MAARLSLTVNCFIEGFKAINDDKTKLAFTAEGNCKC